MSRTLNRVSKTNPVDTGHPLARGLEGLWLPLPHLTGGSRLYDLSGWGRHGGLTADSTWEVASNLATPYLSVPGSDGSISIGTPTLSDPFTFHIFCNLRGVEFDGRPIQIPSDQGQTRLRQADTGAIYWRGGVFDTGGSSSDSSAQGWFLLSGVYGPTEGAVLYFDGDVEASGSYGGDVTGHGTHEIHYSASVQYDFGAVLAYSDEHSQDQVRRVRREIQMGYPHLLRRRDQSALYVSTAGAVTLSASGQGTASSSADLSKVASLSASGQGTAQGSAVLSRIRALTASGQGTALGTISLSRLRSLTASGQGTANGTAALNKLAALVGSGQGTANGTASLTISGGSAVLLSASGQATATGNAALSKVASLNASGQGTAIADVSMTRLRNLSASGTGTANGDASISRLRGFSASGQGTAQGNASLVLVVPLSASGKATAVGDASLTKIASLAASGQGTASGSASLSVTAAQSLATLDATLEDAIIITATLEDSITLDATLED